MENRKNAFTLVELLAIISILGLILIIAVPKIQNTLDNSRKRTLELSIKSIARSAEEAYLEYQTSGITDEITCESVVNISRNEYETCDITFDSDGNASVTYVGNGSYDGLYVCRGTKIDARVQTEECKICLLEYEKVNYNIKDYDSCISYMEENNYNVDDAETLCTDNGIYRYTFVNYIYDLTEYDGYTYEELINNNVIGEDSVYPNISLGDQTSCVNYTKDVWWGSEEELEFLCRGESIWGYTTSDYFTEQIYDKIFNEEELKENNVIDIVNENICKIEETPTSCFKYKEIYEVKNYDSCISYLRDEFVNEMYYTEEELQKVCKGEFTHGGTFSDTIDWLIISEKFSEQELIENNVIKISTENIFITDYKASCGSSVVIPSTINNKNVIEIGSGAFSEKQINGVKLPATIISIGEDAFGSNLLSKVVLGNTSVTTGNCAFGKIAKIKSHNIPNTYYCEYV